MLVFSRNDLYIRHFSRTALGNIVETLTIEESFHKVMNFFISQNVFKLNKIYVSNIYIRFTDIILSLQIYVK